MAPSAHRNVDGAIVAGSLGIRRLSLFARRRAKLLQEKKARYDSITAPDQVVAYQLAQFNAVWAKTLVSSSFYKEWAAKHKLPEKVSSAGELRLFPPLTKEIIREHQEQISFDVAGTDRLFFVSTGGSTGVPTRFPTSAKEKDIEYANTYLGKSWWGIEPFDRVTHLWGHSHLFGAGWRGRAKEWRRRFYDWLINTRRLNAYNMSPDRMSRYVDAIVRSSPEVIIGYTSAVFKTAQYARTSGSALGNAHLKGIIVTAETATGSDIGLIQEVFGKPVIIEYGMAETGVIAYSRTVTEQCAVFWDSFLCIEEQGEIFLSTLYDRCFPLINYRTRDLVANAVMHDGSMLGFSNIGGRVQEVITLHAANGRDLYIVSGILIVHIVKAWQGIYAVSAAQIAEGVVQVQVVAGASLNVTDLRKYLLANLMREFGPIADAALSVIRVSDVQSSVAGKARVVASAIRHEHGQ